MCENERLPIPKEITAPSLTLPCALSALSDMSLWVPLSRGQRSRADESLSLSQRSAARYCWLCAGPIVSARTGSTH